MTRTIKGFENYEITENGEVYSKARTFIDSIGRRQVIHRKMLKQQLCVGNRGHGYMTVALYSNSGSKYKRLKVHRLVAQTFIDNPDDLPVVNHKDTNRMNNHVSNLEWSTYSENTQHAIRKGVMSNFNRSRVRCVETQEEYISAKQAALALGGKDGSSISKCLKGRQETAYGFHWESATTSRKTYTQVSGSGANS